jgi:DNA recombination-dependent growth factor C
MGLTKAIVNETGSGEEADKILSNLVESLEYIRLVGNRWQEEYASKLLDCVRAGEALHNFNDMSIVRDLVAKSVDARQRTGLTKELVASTRGLEVEEDAEEA